MVVKIMKRTRDDPSGFLHQSVYDDDSWSEEFGELGVSEEDNDSPQPQRKHFCVICNKQFSSGKAYGGHVRIHSSEYGNKQGKTKKMKMKKKKAKRRSLVKRDKEKETDLIRADVEGKIRCCVCEKEFQTMHSLFGHMRRHPDRSWKGIRPPPPPPSPKKFKLSFLDDDDDVNGDDDDAMSGSMMMSSYVTKDVQEAACCLMMLNYSAIGTPNSEVRSSRCFEDDKGKVKGKRDGEMDDKGLIVDMKIKMEIEVKVNNPRDDEAKRSLGFDLNQPYHEDHPYSY